MGCDIRAKTILAEDYVDQKILANANAEKKKSFTVEIAQLPWKIKESVPNLWSHRE